jgi:hypothetical protein
MRRRRRSSRAFLLRPAFTIRYPTPAAERTSESVGFIIFRGAPPSVRVRLEIQLATAPIGYVRVQLRRGQVGMAEHLLNAPEVGASLEEMGRERVPEQVGVDPLGLETRLGGQPTQDEEGAGAGQRATLCVEEELRAVAPVEVRPPAGEVAADRFRGLAADRDDPLLVSLAHAAHEAVVERDPAFLERYGFGDAQTGSVQELDEGAVT